MTAKVDILDLMNMLEKTLDTPAAQWKALRELLKIQKSVNNGQKPTTKNKRGRPRKDTPTK
jgi:predicted RNA-binding protein associated with RNAse of E/G family